MKRVKIERALLLLTAYKKSHIYEVLIAAKMYARFRVITTRCTYVHSTVLPSYVVCLSVCPSVCR